MKTVDPGQLLICRQKSISRVLYNHVNPFARNLHVQCCSNLARDTHRSTFVWFSWPGLISTLPLGGGLKSTRGEISTRVKRNASCKRAIHFVHMAGWNLTRVETPHVNTALVVQRQCCRSVSCNIIAWADCLVTGRVYSGHYSVACSSLLLFFYKTKRSECKLSP